MAKSNTKYQSFWFSGFKVEYSKLQKRWFVSDYDDEAGYRDVGPLHPSKYAAMDWISECIGAR